MIIVKDITKMAFSYEDGMKLRGAILEELKSGTSVEVDFDGIYVFTTMFFNACSGHFVLKNSLDWYNEMIKVINLNQMGIEIHRHSIENAQKKRLEEMAIITQNTISDNA